jgi:putative nucleotidyltransferase with HDIG domain
MKNNNTGRSACSAGTVDLYEYDLETARMLTSILDEIHPHLKAHLKRVANNSANFCEKNRLLSQEKVERVYLAALVHDIGKIALGTDLVTGTKAAQREESLEYRRHPVVGEKILSNQSAFTDLLPIVRHHHERYDGNGYPDNKKGGDIPLESRVIAFFDHVDILMHLNSADEPAGLDSALNDATVKSGQYFDPDLMDRFVAFVKETGGESEDFTLKKERATLRKLFTGILKKISAGKITPPVVPKVVQDLQTEIKKQTSNADKLGALIERDPVISLRLISIANSPVYRGVQEISNVRNALPRMGLKETLNIVFGIANKSLYAANRPQFKILMDRLWGHSLATAYAAKLLGQKLGFDDPDNLFLMGLIHDVGKAVLLKAFSDELDAKSYNLEAILANINEAHLSVGAMLIKRWGFSSQIVNTVMHHEGGNYKEDTAREILVIHLANMLTRQLGYSLYPGTDVNFEALAAVQLLKLDPADIAPIGEEVKSIVSEVAHLF